MAHDTKEAATVSPLAGKPAPKSMLVDLARLEREYYERKPDVGDPNQLVGFDTHTLRFVGSAPVPSGGGAVRHMFYDRRTQTIWFGSDANTLGRARVAPPVP